MLIALTGKKGAGKDTAGAFLVRELGFQRLSFADALKQSAAACFGGVIIKDDWDQWKNDPEVKVVIEDGRSPSRHIAEVTVRQFLQFYGTEAHRDIWGPDFWVDTLFKDFTPEDFALHAQPHYVITDCRFESETEAVLKNGGIVVNIVRPETDDHSDTHRSETSVPEEMIDYEIYNDSDITTLERRVFELVNEISTNVPERLALAIAADRAGDTFA